MNFKAVVLCLFMTVSTLATQPANDYKKALEEVSKAVNAGNEDTIAAAVEDMVNLLPEKYTFYGMGISYGQRNEIVFVKSSKMYGTLYQVPVNPRRMVNTDCLYVSETYSGYISFITEEMATIPTCKHSAWMDTVTSIPFKKVISTNEHIKTSGVLTGSGQPVTSLIDVDSHPREIRSFHLGDIGQNYVENQNMIILAGRVIEVVYGTIKIKQFIPSVEITLTPESMSFVIKHEPTPRLVEAIKTSLPNYKFEYTASKNL